MSESESWFWQFQEADLVVAKTYIGGPSHPALYDITWSLSCLNIF